MQCCALHFFRCRFLHLPTSNTSAQKARQHCCGKEGYHQFADKYTECRSQPPEYAQQPVSDEPDRQCQTQPSMPRPKLQNEVTGYHNYDHKGIDRNNSFPESRNGN